MNVIEGFTFWLAQRGRKSSTVTLYSQTLKRVLQTTDKTLDYNDCKTFLFKLVQNKKSARYINIYITTFRLWGEYLKDDRFKDLKQLIEPETSKATFSDSEIEQFLALPCPTCKWSRWGKTQIRQTDPVGWERMRVFWTICAFSGMRMGEVANLQIENLDFGRQVFTIEVGKTGARIVPMAPNIIFLLQSYITELKDSYLFPSRLGGKHDGVVIDDVDWGYSFHKRLKMMGLKRKNLTPYSFRHSYCTRMLESDINLFTAQKIMGHKRLETTQVYSHLTTKDMIDAIKKLPLIRKTTEPVQILQSIAELIKSFGLQLDDRFEYIIEQTQHSFNIKLEIKDNYKS